MTAIMRTSILDRTVTEDVKHIRRRVIFMILFEPIEVVTTCFHPPLVALKLSGKSTTVAKLCLVSVASFQQCTLSDDDMVTPHGLDDFVQEVFFASIGAKLRSEQIKSWTFRFSVENSATHYTLGLRLSIKSCRQQLSVVEMSDWYFAILCI